MGEVSPRIGPDRCLMVLKNPQQREKDWLRRFARGSDQINLLLKTGWEIEPDDRNHLTSDYGQRQHNGHTHDNPPQPQPITTVKRGPGRPPKPKP